MVCALLTSMILFHRKDLFNNFWPAILEEVRVLVIVYKGFGMKIDIFVKKLPARDRQCQN